MGLNYLLSYLLQISQFNNLFEASPTAEGRQLNGLEDSQLFSTQQLSEVRAKLVSSNANNEYLQRISDSRGATIATSLHAHGSTTMSATKSKISAARSIRRNLRNDLLPNFSSNQQMLVNYPEKVIAVNNVTPLLSSVSPTSANQVCSPDAISNGSDFILGVSASCSNSEVLPGSSSQNSCKRSPPPKRSNAKGRPLKGVSSARAKKARNSSDWYDCAICQKKFRAASELRKHLHSLHKVPQPVNNNKRKHIYYCHVPGCNFSTPLRSVIDDHMGHHYINDKITPSGKKRQSNTPPQRFRFGNEEMKCTECDYTCTVEHSYRAHMALHEAGKEIKYLHSCPICGVDMSSQKEVKDHLAKRHVVKNEKGKSQYRCNHCEFASVQLKKLIQHSRMHDGFAPHLCSICDYRTARRDNLRSHIRRCHKKENIYVDSYAPIVYSSLYTKRDGEQASEGEGHSLQTTSNFSVSNVENGGLQGETIIPDPGTIFSSGGNNECYINLDNINVSGLSTMDQMNLYEPQLNEVLVQPHALGNSFAASWSGSSLNEIPLSIPSSVSAASSLNGVFSSLPSHSNSQTIN